MICPPEDEMIRYLILRLYYGDQFTAWLVVVELAV